MAEGQEITTRPGAELANPVADVEFGKQCADALMTVIETKPKKVMINGEQYLEFEDWQTIARFYRCTAAIEWCKNLSHVNGDNQQKFDGWEARAVVYGPTGQILSAAEAQCTVSESKWATRDRFQLRSMAQTRAMAKALRNVFGWIPVLRGLKATPAEELDEITYEDVPYAPAKPQKATEAKKPATPAASVTKHGDANLCSVQDCIEILNDAVFEFSVRKYGKPLCMRHQRGAEKK